MEPAFRGHRGEMRGKGKDHRDFLGDSGGAGWGGGNDGLSARLLGLGLQNLLCVKVTQKSRKLGCGAF